MYYTCTDWFVVYSADVIECIQLQTARNDSNNGYICEASTVWLACKLTVALISGREMSRDSWSLEGRFFSAT